MGQHKLDFNFQEQKATEESAPAATSELPKPEELNTSESPSSSSAGAQGEINDDEHVVMRHSAEHPAPAAQPLLTPNSRRLMRTSESGSRLRTRPELGLDLKGVSHRPNTSSALRSPRSSPRSSPRTIQCVGNYDIGATLGRGRFGKVKLATHVLTRQQVAIKIIRKNKLAENDGFTLIRREISILKRLKHPNIVCLHEVLETDKVLFLIMEYARGGEVLDFIVSHKKLSEPKARHLFRQIVAAISHCHQHNIAHRDLKAENLLLDEHLNIKLIDFGLSNTFSKNVLLKTPCGSPSYAAPEIIEKKDYNGPLIDIWSMGIILHVFVSGALPFKGSDLLSLFTAILACEFELPDYLSEDCKNLISRLLVKNPEERISMEEIKKHPWVVGEDGWQLPNKKTEDTVTEVSSEDLDPNIVQELEKLGFNVDSVLESAKTNQFNSASATLSILMEKKRKESELQTKSVQRTVSDTRAINRMSWNARGSRSPHPSQTPSRGSSSRAETPMRLPISRSTNLSPSVSPTTSPLVSQESSVSLRRREIQRARFRGHKRTMSEQVRFDNIPVPQNSRSKSPGVRMRTQYHQTSPVRTSSSETENSEYDQLDEVDTSSAKDDSESSSLSPDSSPSKSVTHSHRRHKSLGNVLFDPDGKEEETDPSALPLFTPKPNGSSEVVNRMLEEIRNYPKSYLLKKTKASSTQNPVTSSTASTTSTALQASAPALSGPKAITEEELHSMYMLEAHEREEYSKDLAKKMEQQKQQKTFKNFVQSLKHMRKRTEQELTNTEPRQLRSAFHNSMMSSKPPAQILEEIKRVLATKGLPCERMSSYCIRVPHVSTGVVFELEVCQLPNISEMYYIRMKRISGEWTDYRDIIHEFMEGCDM